MANIGNNNHNTISQSTKHSSLRNRSKYHHIHAIHNRKRYDKLSNEYMNTTSLILQYDDDNYINKETNKYLSILNAKQRIKYYMRKWYHHGVDIHIDSHNLSSISISEHIEPYSIFNVSNNKRLLNRQFFKEFYTFLNLSKSSDFKCKRNLHKFALMANRIDDTYSDEGYTGIPYFCKVRSIGSKEAIILKIFTEGRHWFDVYELHNHNTIDPSWENKTNKVIFRGATTGEDDGVRLSFVKQYFNASNKSLDIDVAYNSISQHLRPSLNYLRKSKIKWENLLKYKYIVSIQGNDVATNLKWILMSNSCVFMPIPTRESWAMEGLLKPYIHFIPLTFNNNTKQWNLKQQYEYCLKNDKICHRIAQNGKKFILGNKFVNRTYEMELHKKILDIYCQNNKITDIN